MKMFSSVRSSALNGALVLMLFFLFTKARQRDVFTASFSSTQNLLLAYLSDTHEITKLACAHRCFTLQLCRAFFYNNKNKSCRTYQEATIDEIGVLRYHVWATKDEYCRDLAVKHVQTTLPSSSALLRVGSVIRSYKCVYPYTPCPEVVDPLTCTPNLHWSPYRVCFRTAWNLRAKGGHNPNVIFRLKCCFLNATIDVNGTTFETANDRKFGIMFRGTTGNITHVFKPRADSLFAMETSWSGISGSGPKLFLSRCRWRYEKNLLVRFFVTNRVVAVDLEGRFATYSMPAYFLIKEVHVTGLLSVTRFVVKV